MKFTNKTIDFTVSTVNDLPTVDVKENQTVVVSDKDRGGVFIARLGGTVNNGTIFQGDGTCNWHRQYDGSVNVKWFGAKGDGVTDDTQIINNIISLEDASVNIEFSNGDFILDLAAISTSGKSLFLDFKDNALLNGEATSSFYFRDDFNGSANNLISTLPTNGIVNKYQSLCDITGAGTQELYGYYFNMISDGTSNEPVRGVIGNVKGKGAGGEYKAIRVGAHDISGAGEGVQTVMAYSGSVSPTDDTGTSIAMQLSHQPANVVSDKTTFINLDTWDFANRIQNGIVFAQGMEFNDAVLQASMDTGSSANARFLKLKDGAANIKFSVEKDGLVKTVVGVSVGTNAPMVMDSSSLSRSVTGGNIVINAGDTGSIFLQDGGVTTAQFGNKGLIKLNGLPTSDPLVANQLWNDNGILKISAG